LQREIDGDRERDRRERSLGERSSVGTERTGRARVEEDEEKRELSMNYGRPAILHFPFDPYFNFFICGRFVSLYPYFNIYK